MTKGIKFSIALAITVPLLIVGSGMALAAGDGSPVDIRDSSTTSPYAASPLSTGITAADDDICPGLCQGNGAGLCDGECDGDCDGDCNGACDGECDGDCLGTGSCGGQRLGSGACGNGCGIAVAQPSGRAYRGSGCGQRVASQQNSVPACTSCDVAGLNFDNPILFNRPATNA